MNRSEEQLRVGYRQFNISNIKENRTRHVITFNPNKVNPNEELYIDLPTLKPDSCLVPGSTHLLYDFKNANTKSWFLKLQKTH